MQYPSGKINFVNPSFYKSLKSLFSKIPSDLKSMLFLEKFHRIHYKKSSFSYYPILFTLLRVKDKFADNELTSKNSWKIKQGSWEISNSIEGTWEDLEIISEDNTAFLEFPKYRFFYKETALNYIKKTYTKNKYFSYSDYSKRICFYYKLDEHNSCFKFFRKENF